MTASKYRLFSGALAIATAVTWLAVTPLAGHGQSRVTGQLTLADAVQRALERHPSVGAARASSDAARSVITTARAARLPSLALTGSATRYEQPMLVTPIHGFGSGELPLFNESLVQGAATIDYTLFDGGARGAKIRGARERAAAAEATVDGSEQSLMARTATSYVQVLARQQVVDAHDRRIAALEAELSRARQRFEVGRAPQVEVLRAEASLASARAERVHFAEALDLAERELARLTGAGEDETRAGRLVVVRLADSLLSPRAELLDAARSASPAVARARLQAAAAEADVSVAKGALWPKIRLGATYYQRGSADTRSWGEWSTGAVVSFPLFTGGATSSEVARTRAGQREMEEQLHLAELQLAQELDRAHSAVQEAAAREASLSSAAARFAEVARIEKLALDAGSGTQADYITAEADLLAARASLAEATMNGLAARMELARVTGELSLPWLQRVLETGP